MPITENERAEIERKIEEVLRAATSAVRFSQAVHGKDGLFNILAGHTKGGLVAVAKSDLWRRVMAKLSELQAKELGVFEQNVAVYGRKKTAEGYDPKIGQD